MINNNQKSQGGKMTKLRRSSLYSFFTGSNRVGDISHSPRQALPTVSGLVGIAAIAMFLALPTSAQAASFDCNKVLTEVEELICLDMQLSGLDNRLAAAYKQALDAASDKEGLKRSQAVWLKGRDTCKRDWFCLEASYKARIVQLTRSGLPANTRTTQNGRYVLEKGIGVEICEAYLKNLNSFDSNTPMRCDRPVNPEFKELQKPEWKQIDVQKNFDLLLKADQLLEPNYYKRDERLKDSRITDSRIKQLRSAFLGDSPESVLSITEVDIDNDGKTEPVLYYHHECILAGSKGPCGTSLVVLQPNVTEVDIEKNKILAAQDGRALYGYHSIFGVFKFRQDVYFDYWNDDLAWLRIMHTKNGKTEQVCLLNLRKK